MTTTTVERKPRKPFPALEPGKKHEFFIPQWRPATVNQIYGNGPRFWKGASLKKRDRRMVEWHIPRSAKIDPSRPVFRRVHMVLRFAKGERRPDRDNVWKSVLDALKHAGAIQNDSPIWCDHTPVVMERTTDGTNGTIIILEDL